MRFFFNQSDSLVMQNQQCRTEKTNPKTPLMQSKLFSVTNEWNTGELSNNDSDRYENVT